MAVTKQNASEESAEIAPLARAERGGERQTEIAQDIWQSNASDVRALPRISQADTDKLMHSLGMASSADLLGGDQSVVAHAAHGDIGKLLERVPRGGEVSSPEAQRINQRYGVQVRQRNGRYEYSYTSNGKEHVLFDTDGSPEGLKEADEKLKKLVEERTKNLEQRFGISVAREGSSTDNPTGAGPDRLTARQPTLGELDGLEAALMQSEPSNRTADPNKKVEVMFTNEQPREGYQGYHDRNTHRIFLFPEVRNNPPTEADAEAARRRGEHPRDSIQDVLTHEFAHQGQNTTGWLDEDRQRERAGEIGWAPRTVTRDGKTVTEFELKGKDGYLYQLDRTDQNNPVWRRRNAQGQYIDSNGHPVEDPAKAHTLNNEQMRQNALVRPSTSYFDTPVEVMAEGSMNYRRGERSRAQLMQQNPELYKIVKKYDQMEIDIIHGKNPDGTPRMIRLPDGTVGPNTPANAMRVLMFETGVRAPRR